MSPKQATPVLFDKYRKIVYHLRNLLLSNGISPSERYIYDRDLAFFLLDFFSGDRSSDLGRVKTVDVFTHPDSTSLLFHQHVGKTLRGKHSRAFAVKQTANPAICPVRNLQFLVNLCKSMRVDLSSGFLFRHTSKRVVFSMHPSSLLLCKQGSLNTFHLLELTMANQFTVSEPGTQSSLDFSVCLERK